MSKIKYKISQLDGQVLEGEAVRLFVKDASTILTLSAGHAPLIATLSSGMLRIDLPTHEQIELSYVEALLYLNDNLIDISVIQ